MMKDEMHEELVVGVDTGRILIIDPCYIKERDLLQQVLAQIRKPLDEPARALRYADGAPGLGIVVGTGYGDGTYEVEVETFEDPNWGPGERVKSVTIRFA